MKYNDKDIYLVIDRTKDATINISSTQIIVPAAPDKTNFVYIDNTNQYIEIKKSDYKSEEIQIILP